MVSIGEKTISSASRLLDALLKKHATEIDSAYLKTDDSFKVDLSVKFKPAEGGNIELEVGINFIKERCKDSVKGQINENIDDLFSQKKESKYTTQEVNKTVVEVEKVVAIEKGKPAITDGTWVEEVQ